MERNDEDLLLDMLMRWEEVRERGQEITIGDLCRRHPDLLEELASRLKALEATSWLEQPSEDEDPPDGDAPGPEPISTKIFSGRYRLDALIAEGGFAQVWKGTDLQLKRVVAVKIPKPNRLDSAGSFLDEAQRVARLKHDRIVPVFDVGREGATCFIVSEFVEGGSLRNILAVRTLPREQSVRWACEIAEALEYAHRQGVVHRDIKPANILIDHHDRAKLADFGIAQSPLKAGKSLGTLRYMSPEQLAGKPTDGRSDIYSLGVVLHECLTGELPYPDGCSKHIPVGVEKVLPKAVSRRVPKALRRICERSLSKDPSGRPASASAFADALRSAARRSFLDRLVPPVAIVLGLACVAAIMPLLYGPFANALRPRLATKSLPDWKCDGQDLFGVVSSLAAASSRCIPRPSRFAAKTMPYEQMGGGVVAPNGKVYCMPSPSGSILAIDPIAKTTARVAAVPDFTGAYFGGVLAPDGCIYGIPHIATRFFRLDPRTHAVTSFGEVRGDGAYWGGVVANNGKIYCIPSSSTAVLEVDPVTQELTYFGILPSDQYKYSGGVLAPNGKIYCMPDRADRILVIDPATHDITFIDQDLGPGATKTFGGVLAPNGKIYSGLAAAPRVVVIDPAADSLSTIENLPPNKYIGGVLGPDGKIYCIPHRHSKVLVIDPDTHATSVLPDFETSGGHWGAVLAPHGSIIGVPWEAHDVLMIDFGTSIPQDWALSRLFNKF